ncbi:MAG: DUF86 domain-containing protein [Candidatus Cloacimonetes bacterium]|nr:DUF86 domain-containing protein [Candidatus Cloacimonadota bacterium]
MKYKGVIENKLRLIESKVEEIRSWNITSINDIKKSSLIRNAVERALQVAIEIMIDIAERILALENCKPAISSAKAISKMEDLSIIKDSDKYIDMVRYRNFIVRRYEYVDINILFTIVNKKLSLFESFVDEIRKVNTI